MQVALRHPKLVHKLVLASTFYKREGCYASLWEGFPHAELEQMPPALREGYLKVAPDPRGLEVQFRRTVTLMMGFKDLDETALRNVVVPTLILVGDADVIKTEHAVEMKHVFPRAHLAVFPGVHGAYLGVAETAATKPASKLPELTVALLDEFLNEKG